jgi:hypothetical protein
MSRTSILGVATIVWATGGPTSAQSLFGEAQIYEVSLRAAVGFTYKDLDGRRLPLVRVTRDSGAVWRDFEDTLDPKRGYCLHPRCLLPFAKPETVEAFLTASGMSRPLPPELGALREFILVDAADFETFEARRNFARRHKVARDTIVSVSGIGFDSTKTQALVYVTFGCGSLCGHTTFVMTELTSAGWTVVKTHQFIQS